MPTVSKKAILAELQRLYPDARPELNFSNPYETLVATILSAQCTDKQVNKVTPAVFARFPDAVSMAAASVDELYPMVKSCGFKTKANNIIEACKLIALRHGGEVPSTMEELTALPGVGRKTANVVMANAFGVPAIAVDTHVFRVSNRLGLADADDVLKTELQLQKAIPKSDWSAAHHWLIYHGRRVCKAQRPLCESCTLRDMCKAERQRKKTAKTEAKATGAEA
ncbi:MAG: endonuclease III [Christensenellaceae bacterium]|nr:endonuclease III [Christensenellaceae bacterium]